MPAGSPRVSDEAVVVGVVVIKPLTSHGIGLMFCNNSYDHFFGELSGILRTDLCFHTLPSHITRCSSVVSDFPIQNPNCRLLSHLE